MAQLINVNTLQEEINEDIENYRNLANNKEVPVDVLTEIIETILVEREILLDEIENFNRYNFGKFNQEQSFRLILQNINPETINNLQITASKLGLTTGELLNTMMKKSLENDKFPTITSTDLIDIDKIKPVFNISHHENLFIAKKDLDFDGKVSFNNIEVLKFDKDIDENLFCDKIHSINHCKEIYLPKISKLLAFAKLHSCISVYIP